MSQHTADQRLADFHAIPVIDIHDLLHGDALTTDSVAKTASKQCYLPNPGIKE